MCKTRSKDNARTSCDGNAAASTTTTTTTAAMEEQALAPPCPLLRETICEVTTTTTTAAAAAAAVATTRSSTRMVSVVQPVVAAGDATTMQKILLRDQRTTYHRLISSAATSTARTSPIRQFQQQLQQQPPQSSAVGSNHRCCPLPEILMSGDSMPWCLSSHQDRVKSRSSEHQLEYHPPVPKSFVKVTSNNRKHKVTLTDVDVEIQQSQLQLQRTCKVQKYRCDDSEDDDIVVLSENNLSTPHCQLSSTTHRNKSFIALVTWLRLVGLLVALSLVSVESAPTAMTLESRRLDQAPKWLNPCGFVAEEFEGDLDVVQLNDATLLGNIVMQAKTALNYAHGFRDDFIKKTFNTDYADLHSTWKDNHYDWLPGPKQIPKKLGEDLDQDYLHKLEVRMLDTALLDAYEYMQRYAVGLEQIAWDQEDYALDFRKQFKDTEYNLRSVLCELQMALAERGVAPRADVTREVMSIEFRDMSESTTYRNLRDWLIFRDYMNGLEYVVQVFEHFIRCFES